MTIIISKADLGALALLFLALTAFFIFKTAYKPGDGWAAWANAACLAALFTIGFTMAWASAH